VTWEGLSPPYGTIVADPPWEYNEGWPPWAGSQDGRKPLPYSSLTIDAIASLPMRSLAGPEAFVFLWTTNRYLPAAFDVLTAWRFRYRQTLTWCKEPVGVGPGGMFATTTEFVLVGQRLGPASNARHRRTNGERIPSSWFQAKRGDHSVKPAVFLDMVETVSPGPYVELFARSPRLGWDSWGWGWE
jgi:N6-adenosine-specific RNA methylase IME4